MNSIDRRALLRGLVSLPAITPMLTLPDVVSASPRPDLDGLGMIYLDGRPVYFDSNDYKFGAGVDALVLNYTGRGTGSPQVQRTVEYSHIGPCRDTRHV